MTNFPEAPFSILHGTVDLRVQRGTALGAALGITPLATGAELYVDVALNVKK